MANIKFTNFARSQLAIGVAPGATSITVTGGTGAKFPVIAAGQHFYVTIENALLSREIVKVTARAGDVFTVVRGQDGTTAALWNAADVVSLRFNAAAIVDSLSDVVGRTSATGSATIPAGSTAQRDVVPTRGSLRYNTTDHIFEGYLGAVPAWGEIGGGGGGGGGGGATGGGADQVFYENDQAVNSSYTITSGKHAMSAGPITIAPGVTVTVPVGSTYTIV